MSGLLFQDDMNLSVEEQGYKGPLLKFTYPTYYVCENQANFTFFNQNLLSTIRYKAITGGRNLYIWLNY